MFDDPPPWVLVPEMDPDDPDGHGVGEAYVLLDWLRSWRLLPNEQQAAYLDRWDAPPAWRRAIPERYDHGPIEIDRTALAALEGDPTPPRRPWWRFRR